MDINGAFVLPCAMVIGLWWHARSTACRATFKKNRLGFIGVVALTSHNEASPVSILEALKQAGALQAELIVI